MTKIFVYGTLKRGCCNHRFLAGQRFITEARTLPHYALYDLGGYPGMVAVTDQPQSVQGEVWEVDETALRGLDTLEGLEEGEYRRVQIPLASPHEGLVAEGYEYLREVDESRRLGEEWVEG
jgi:gamma-glutamylaminecyclotransferase